MKSERAKSDWYAGDLFGEIYQAETNATPTRRASLWALVPGLLVCGTAALAALWLADQYGFPAILLGLLIGLALNFLSDHPRTGAGLDFASKNFLRGGIVLLGLQITLMQIGDVGWLPFAGLFAIMAVSFGTGMVGAKISGQSRYAGILAGGATAICGASAALALYSIIGKNRLDQARFTVVLMGIALASAIALSFYPALAGLLGFNDIQAGYLIGASIHDAGQAIGGGYAVSPDAGAQATIVKLTRVALLAPIVGLVAFWIGTGGDGEKTSGWKRFALPPFITVFLLIVLANSAIELPTQFRDYGLTASKTLLLLAVTATAMRSRMDLLLDAGWKPLVPVLSASIASFATAVVVAETLIG